MAHIFDVTASSEKAVSLNTEGTGEVSFTVTNVTNSPVKGRAVMGPENSPVLRWLTLMGEAERMIQPKLSDTFVVKVKVPPGSKPGDYSFRLDAISIARPDEDSTQGPTIAIPVTLAPPPHKPFPWWILVVAAVVIGGLSYAALKLIPNDEVVVPAVVGKSLADGEASLTAMKLKLGPVDRVIADNTNIDKILKQSPAPPAKVPPGSSIGVQIGTALVVVPPLKGTLEAAKKALSDAHLDLGEIKTINQAGVLTPGIVLDSNPPEGNTLETHSKVALIVQAATVEVPDLSGKTFPGAVRVLRQHNLTFGSLKGNIMDINDTDTRPFLAEISDWSPKGQSVGLGTPITLVFPGDVNVPINAKEINDAPISDMEEMEAMYSTRANQRPRGRVPPRERGRPR